MELVVDRFVLVLECKEWKTFGSQELLIERLLCCSLGIKLTQILARRCTANPECEGV